DLVEEAADDRCGEGAAEAVAVRDEGGGGDVVLVADEPGVGAGWVAGAGFGGAGLSVDGRSWLVSKRAARAAGDGGAHQRAQAGRGAAGQRRPGRRERLSGFQDQPWR